MASRRLFKWKETNISANLYIKMKKNHLPNIPMKIGMDLKTNIIKSHESARGTKIDQKLQKAHITQRKKRCLVRRKKGLYTSLKKKTFLCRG